MSKLIHKYKKLPVQVRASIWFMFCTFMQKGISVITTPIFTRLLTTEEYGQYVAFDSWLGILTIFISMRLYMGVYLQGIVKFSEDRKVFSSSLEGLCTTLTLGWTIVYLLFRNFWNGLLSLTTTQMLCALVMIWATSAYHFWAGEQRTDYKYRRLVIITVISSIAKPLLSVIMILNSEDKVTARIMGLAIVELVAYCGLFVVQMVRGKTFYSKKYWKYALMFNLPLIPHYLSQTVLASSDRIMIKALVGASAAGIYGLSYKLSQIMTLFNTALNQTMTPWMYSKIKQGRSQDIGSVGYLCLLIVCGVNLTLIAIAPEALVIFAPNSYHEALYCIPPVALAVIFTFSYDLFAKFEFYYEKTKFIMVASVIGAALNIGLNYVFIGLYGYAAAAYTTLFCYIIYALAHYIMMCRVCKAHDCARAYDGKKLLLIYVTVCVAGFALMATYDHTAIRYGLLAAALIALIINRRRVKKALGTLVSLRKKKAPAASGVK